MASTKIKDISSGDKHMMVIVRICRIWNWPKRNRIEEDGLQFILVDDQNNAIHAVMRHRRNSQKFSLGLIYKISGFHCMNNLEKYVIVRHRHQLLFDDNTEFKHMPNVYPSLPLYWFEFTDYSSLGLRQNNDKILTDVIGRIVSTYPFPGVSSNQYVVQIQNSRNENITLYLTREAAQKFDVATKMSILTPTIAAFTSTLVRTFHGGIELHSTINTCIFIDPWINETHDLKSSFQQQSNALLLEDIPIVATDIEVLYDTFTTKAVIISVEFDDGWYYMACPNCNVKLKPRSGTSVLSCQKHGDQEGIPLYEVKITLEDGGETIEALLKGRTADALFGIQCQEMVNERGYTDMSWLPQELADRHLRSYIWELAYQPKKPLIVQAFYSNQHRQEEEIIQQIPTSTIAEIKKLITLHVQAVLNEREQEMRGAERQEKDGASTSTSAQEKQES